jgi:hypothetical protein
MFIAFSRRATVVLTLLLVAGCSEQPRLTQPLAPHAAAFDVARASETPTTSVRWNETSRSLVASHNTNGPMASRVYALVSMAQFAVVAAVDDADRHHGHSHPSLRAAIARASSAVLGNLYPDAATSTLLAAQLALDETPDGQDDGHADIPAGDAIGTTVAQTVIARAATDGAAAANCPATPPLPANQFWHDDAVPPNPQPVLPCFGQVRPWLHIDVRQFRAGPPPAFGSPAFLAGLDVVRQISNTRTADQLATIDRWLDGNNTLQPPGHWNAIASDLITRHHLDEAAAARALAILNVAMMDTHIACWDRKYFYWEIRPWMVDATITTPRGQPHHPANPSGHACAGGAGSGALGGIFPAERDSLAALGNEAGFTTVLSGVHYPFDVDVGLRMGRAIAERALDLHSRDELLELLTSR